MTQSQIDQLIKENQELKAEIAKLVEQMKKMTETVNYLTERLYGRKSEKADVLFGGQQMSIFNELEMNADSKAKEPEVETETLTYTRKKRPKGKKEADLKGLAHQKVVHMIKEEQRICNKCGSEMKRIGETFVHSEVVFVPAQVFVKDHYIESYECFNCRKTEEKAQIIKANTPVAVMKGSYASASSVAYMLYQKFVNAVPLYRQEKDWERVGIPLSRATMANWGIITARDYFIPMRDRMAQALKDQPVIHADETPVKVHREEGRKDNTDSYMWVYTSGYDSTKPISIYDYCPGRGGKYPREFLRGFKGILQTDGYAGYDQIPDVTRCLCWVHCRRNFKDALPKEIDKRIESLAGKGLAYCSKLSKIDEEILKLKPEDRPKARHEKEDDLIEAFYQWLETASNEVLPKSKLGEAIRYAQNHKKELTNYMDNGYAVLSNNIAERAVRPFTIGRKNWLFSGSPKGAKASAAIYSMIETAKANDLDPYLYLHYLLTELPGKDTKHHPEILDAMMPWQDEVKARCKKGTNKQAADIFLEDAFETE